MGLTTAMYTGLSGLNVNQARIETVGHNIANVNTTAFRGSRTLFQTQFAQTLSQGTAPSEFSGGTNPMQIGHGAMVGTTQRLLAGGSLETTGEPSDMAVEGAGYFVVQSAAGRTSYTRDGSFSLNASNQLVTMDGRYLLGYGVDETGAVVPGTLQPLNIPIGKVTLARPTSNVILDGDLSAGETLATQGSRHASQALVDGGNNAAAAGTALTDLRSSTASGTVLFATGDVITVSGATRGGRDVGAQQFIVGSTGNTLGEFAAWLQSTLGIQSAEGLTGQPGVTVEAGALVIRSNVGEPNAIDISGNDLLSSSATIPLPFQFTPAQEALGGGVVTGFTVYDSLGNPVQVNATFVLESTPNTGPVWRYFLESADPDVPRTMGTGTVTFDTQGRFVSATGNPFAIDRSNTGAATPLSVALDFSTINGLSTLASNVILADQDGYPPGTLDGFSVGVDGTLTGTFSNGLSQTLGQVALATFTNEAGLIAESDNLYSAGPNSGPAAVSAPGTLGAGQIRGGALEMSNVDLSREFISLITSSTGFQASSRVISTANDMLDQLLLALR